MKALPPAGILHSNGNLIGDSINVLSSIYAPHTKRSHHQLHKLLRGLVVQAAWANDTSGDLGHHLIDFVRSLRCCRQLRVFRFGDSLRKGLPFRDRNWSWCRLGFGFWFWFRLFTLLGPIALLAGPIALPRSVPLTIMAGDR